MSLDKSEEKISRTSKQVTTTLCYFGNNTKVQRTVIFYLTCVFSGLKYIFPLKRVSVFYLSFAYLQLISLYEYKQGKSSNEPGEPPRPSMNKIKSYKKWN